MMYVKWLWMECEKFTATVDLNQNDTVIDAPPQMKNFVGKHKSCLEFYLKSEYPDIEIQERKIFFNDNS